MIWWAVVAILSFYVKLLNLFWEFDTDIFLFGVNTILDVNNLEDNVNGSLIICKFESVWQKIYQNLFISFFVSVEAFEKNVVFVVFDKRNLYLFLWT